MGVNIVSSLKQNHHQFSSSIKNSTISVLLQRNLILEETSLFLALTYDLSLSHLYIDVYSQPFSVQDIMS